MYIVVIALVIIVAIFGVSSGMQSYATAEQARAQIETAKAAQAATAGNLVTIVMVAVVVGMLLAFAALLAWMWLRRGRETARGYREPGQGPRMMSGGTQPQIEIEQLLQLKMLEMLSSMSNDNRQPQETGLVVRDEEPFYWLKQ